MGRLAGCMSQWACKGLEPAARNGLQALSHTLAQPRSQKGALRAQVLEHDCMGIHWLAGHVCHTSSFHNQTQAAYPGRAVIRCGAAGRSSSTASCRQPAGRARRASQMSRIGVKGDGRPSHSAVADVNLSAVLQCAHTLQACAQDVEEDAAHLEQAVRIATGYWCR